MRLKAFRFCMLVGAATLGAVALYYFINYAIVLSIALGNSGIGQSLQASIRAMWLAFACQALLVGVLYVLVAFRPRSVSREVIVLFGLLQLLEAVLLFSFANYNWMAYLLMAAAVFVLLGAILWPKRLPPEVTAPTTHQAAPVQGSAATGRPPV